MFPKLLLLAVALLHLSSLARSESVTIKDISGRSIKVEILGVSETLVAIEQDDGRIFDISLDRLAPDSRLLVELWAKQKEIEDHLNNHKVQLEVSVEFAADRKEENRAKLKGTFFIPTVKISNPNSDHEYKELKGTLLVIGENRSSAKILRVLDKQEFTFDLPSKRTSIWGGEPFIGSYLKNNHNSGYEMSGYIILLENEKKEIIYAYGTNPLWILPASKGLTLLEMADYDRSLSSYR